MQLGDAAPVQWMDQLLQAPAGAGEVVARDGGRLVVGKKTVGNMQKAMEIHGMSIVTESRYRIYRIYDNIYIYTHTCIIVD